MKNDIIKFFKNLFKKDIKEDISETTLFLFVLLILLIPLLLIFFTICFWWVNYIFFKEFSNPFTLFYSNMKEIVILSAACWALAFYYITNYFHTHEPKKTKTLADSEWQSIEKQKMEFKVAPIDTNYHLEEGGAPINKISDSELLYDVAPMHDITMGITRSGKSRKIVRQLVMLASMAGESMIFNDPKKEMYQDFHLYLEKKGYDVYCLDFRKLDVSNAWNPMSDIVYYMEKGDIDDADQYAQDLVSSLVLDTKNSEPIWIEGQKALINALLLEVASAPISKSKKSFYSVVQMISQLGYEVKIDKQSKLLLSAYMEQLDPLSPSKLSYTAIQIAPDKTRGSFMTSTLTTLRPFTGMKLMKVLSHSDFDFKDFQHGKKALFVVNPDEKETYKSITGMLFDNAYRTLAYEASSKPGMKLKHKVHMILDEFGNMPEIPNIEAKLTVALGRNIIYHLYLQDFKQMNQIYGDNVARIIRGNCGIWYFISSADFETCEEMSQKVGDETIWVKSQSGNYSDKAKETGGSISYNQQTRRLITANQLLSSDMRDGKGIIVYRLYLGPCRVDLPDCTQYKWYSEMEHDESETVNEGLYLDYAIPRYLIISRKILFDRGLPDKLNELTMHHENPNFKTDTLYSDEMYWYWSTRDDLGPTILDHIVERFKKGTVAATRESIRTYMKSKEFTKFVNGLDDKEKNDVHKKNNLNSISKTNKLNSYEEDGLSEFID